MSEYLHRPGYRTPTEWHYAFANRPVKNAPDTWVSYIEKIELHYPSIYRIIQGWANTLGSPEALDDFLFEFFFDQNVEAPRAVPLELTRSGSHFPLRDEVKINPHRVDSAFAVLLETAIYHVDDHSYDVPRRTGNDNLIFLLFAICFHSEFDVLYDWLRGYHADDAFVIAECLVRGMSIPSIENVLASGVDTAVIDSMLGGAV
jgi:hypothetical protein